MGAATCTRLRRAGRHVIGIDIADADIDADLADPNGRRQALEALGDQEVIAVATFAGVTGFSGRAGSLVASVNYFGTVELLEGLLPSLSIQGGSALAISSNTASTATNIDDELVTLCLAGDEASARRRADEVGAPAAYAASKLAIAPWVRRQAPTAPWAGSGVRLNAIAPGMVETALVAEMRQEPGASKLLERTALPIGRGGRPEEVAALAELLLGPEGGFFVGSVLFLDGGTDAYYRSDDWPAPRRREDRER
jgi:NAD(P)-dependent dehydrogenase (short-subunit alcohol dehydrogenase family)